MPSPADRTGVSTQRNSPRENRSRPLRVLAQRITRIEKGCSKLTATNLPRLLPRHLVPRFSSPSVLVFFVTRIEKLSSPEAILVNIRRENISLTGSPVPIGMAVPETQYV
jgi:hypothetical protein